MAATTLPRFMVLFSESAGKYVRYVSEGGELNRILAAKGGQATGPHSKLEVVPSEVHPTMIHIRCSYNNRFLRRRSESEWWIVAAADEPVDDLSQWSCTLFEPEILANGSVRLLHIQLGRYAEWYNDSTHPYSMCIWAQSTSPAEAKAAFQVTAWETLMTWPKRVAFRGDNGHYLGPWNGPIVFSFSNPGDTSAANEIEVVPNTGNIRIRNVLRGQFWKRHDDDNDTIYATDDSTATPPSPDSVFSVTKVSNNDTIALRNLGNNQICRREAGSVHDYLRSKESGLSDQSLLVLVEPVASRRIEDIKFHLDDGWVHDVTRNVVLQDAQPVSNETDETQTIKVDIIYKDRYTSTWKATNANTSFRPVGPVVEIKPDEIPYVTGPSPAIGMAPPPLPSYVWGTTQGIPHQLARAHEVTLPPWTTATVKLSATVATCNVPLTYTRYDILDETEGKETVHIMEDGVYTGTNCFDFQFEDSAPQPITGNIIKKM